MLFKLYLAIEMEASYSQLFTATEVFGFTAAANIKGIPGLNLQGTATKLYLRGHTLLLKTIPFRRYITLC